MSSRDESGSEHGHSTRTYHAVFGALLAALVVSIFLAEVWGGVVMVTTIFIIAAVKAWLVVNHFMHLKDEPHWVRVLVLSMLVALVCFFVGVYVDVVTPFGGMEAP